MRLNLLVLNLLFTFWSSIYAQVPGTFVPSPIHKSDTILINKANQLHEKELAMIPEVEKGIKKYISDQYKRRNNYILNSVKNGNFLSGSFAEKYVNNVFANILKANPELNQDMQVLVSRSPMINALSLGDGTFIIYSGLLQRLNNEAELAFILCHEISHYEKRHTEANLMAFAEKYLNKDFKKEIKKVLKEEYMVKQKLVDLVMPDILEDMRYSRHHEMEADSIGLSYYLKTNYDPAQAVSAMSILEHADEEYDASLIDFKSVFSVDELPFNNNWLYYEEESSLGTFEEEKDELEDSLKTHPDAKDRAIRLSAQLEGRNTSVEAKKFIQAETDFAHLKMVAEGEIIETYYRANKIERAIFLSIQMMKHWPHDTIYPRTNLSRCFSIYSIKQRQKRAGEVISLPNTFYYENFNRLISFLWELKISESAVFSKSFLPPPIPDYMKYEHYAAAYVLMNLAQNNLSEFEKSKTSYLKSFNQGPNRTIIEKINIP